jgi:hypothetical protein
MAKEVQWGDLWPGWYAQGNRRRVRVLDPDSKEAQLRKSKEAEVREEAERLRMEEIFKTYGLLDIEDNKQTQQRRQP